MELEEMFKIFHKSSKTIKSKLDKIDKKGDSNLKIHLIIKSPLNKIYHVII